MEGLTELELFDSFPEGFEPNEAQKDIIKNIGQALDEKKKFIIINAPTATGKSFIAKTIANYSADPSKDYIEAVENFSIYDSENAFGENVLGNFGTAILTVSKNLQDQYISMFQDGDALKGKNNYPCEIMEGYSCENGLCVYMQKQLKKCIKNNCCPYYKQRTKAAINKCSFYNYAMFSKLPENIKHKEFIICDEASELEAELVSQYTFELVISDLNKIDQFMPVSPGISDNNSTYYKWVCNISRRCEQLYGQFITEISKEFKNNNRKKKLNKTELSKLNLLQRYKETTKNLLEAWNDTQYLIKRESGKIIFQPYNVDKLAHYIFDCGKTIILMSATIVDHKIFAKTLGIEDYYYIEAKMTLESKKAPIKCTSRFKLNYRNKSEMLPLMSKAVEAICEKHAGQKGIIHTHSMDILNSLRKNIKDQSRFLYREDGISNEKILETHKNTDKPTILVSPSMTHGVDLKGKLGEFQIIMKAPYLPLNDERVKMKFEKDKAWYNNAMLSTLIQACGRCNRSADDYSVTYLLDANIVTAIKRSIDKLPKYFLERFS